MALFSTDFSKSRKINKNLAPTKSRPYKFTVTSLEPYETQAGNARIKFEMVVQDDGYKGRVIRDGLNIPDGSKNNEFYVNLWRTFLECLGTPAAKLSKNKLDVQEKDIIGKSGYCYYTTQQDTGTKFSKVEYIDQDTYTYLLETWDDTDVEMEDEDDDVEGIDLD